MADEDRAETIKRFEALYKLSAQALTDEHDRFASAEQKADRYLGIAIALLGLSGFALGPVLEVVRGGVDGGGELGLVCASVAFVAFILLAISNGFSALSVGVTKSIPLSKVMSHYLDNPYLPVLRSMSKGFLIAAEQTRANTDEKYSLVKVCFNMVVAALASGVVASVFYVWLVI